MTIGARIRLIRKHKGLSQTEFGKRIGLKQTAIGQYENNQHNVADRTILLICSEFNVCEEWLRNGTGPMFKETDESIITEIATQYRLGELDKAIMKIYLELPPDKKDAFKDFAFALVDTVLNNETLFMEYREKYVAENALPFAARGGDTSQLMEAAELFDNSFEQKEGHSEVE